MPVDGSDDEAVGVDSRGVDVIEANYELQGKVGKGPLDERVVDRCQHVMDNHNVDFSPLARQCLDSLEAVIERARAGEVPYADLIEQMVPLVMQLKANASVFDYGLIGSMANIMLGFLEAIDEVDEDVLTIVSAHYTTLSAIVDNEMKGDGGAVGQQMEGELRGACERYFAKRK